MPYTLVCFHAHPDDEALLTAGTMAKVAAAGHRVVLVVATAGERGLASPALIGQGRLGAERLGELHASARVLGVARVVHLGYQDSGLGGHAGDPAAVARDGPARFVDADVEEAAVRLAQLLTEERADVLTSYDPAGGYGHPDHVQVHRVGRRAAELAGTPVLLEATVDRDLLRRGLRWASLVYRFPPEFDAAAFARAYTPREELTHLVRVGRFASAKRAAMAAHASQSSGGSGERTLAAFQRLPGPLFRMVFGREWYRQTRPVPPPAGPLHGDPFAALRGQTRRTASAGGA